MNFKTLALAGTMALAPMSHASAQASRVAHSAQKIVVADTAKVAADSVKTMSDAFHQSPMVGRYKGHLDFSVGDGGRITKGQGYYTEKAHSLIPETTNQGVQFDVNGSYVMANGLPTNAYRLEGSARQANNQYGVHTQYAGGGHGKSNFGGGVSYRRYFPLLNNHEGSKLEAFGDLSATADIRRMAIQDKDHLGIAHATLVGGLSGNAKLGNFNLGGEAFVGGGESIRLKANADKKDSYSHFSWGARVKAGFKKVYAFFETGKSPVNEGTYNAVGAGVNF